MAEGDKNGLPFGNTSLKRTKSLITVKELKDTYLFGLRFTDSEGNDLSDAAFQTYIDNAVGLIETYLDIAIIPRRNFVENRDYRRNEYFDWGFFEVTNYPILKINKIELAYFRGNMDNDETVLNIPDSWIRVQEHDGIIRLIPNARFPANLQISSTGNFFPEILRTDMIPHAWRIDYDYGFEDGCIPVLVDQAIAIAAAMQALIVGGNLVLGAGIASSSISLDGLSQSINTTQSAENSAYSATLKDYRERLFGANKDDPFAILKQLKAYYKGHDLAFI